MKPRSELSSEQRRRMAEVFRAEGPTDLEISRALRRFQARGPRGPSLSRSVASWALVGALAGVAAMLVSGALGHEPAAASGIHAEALVAPRVLPPAAPAPVQKPLVQAPTATPSAPPERTAPRVEPRAPTAPSVRAPAPPPAASADVARDNDDLARAERWLAVGRGKDAAPILSGLEEHGATDAIRKRAAELAGGTKH